MELTQLQIMKELLRTGSISDAALKLHYSKVFVSKQLAALEQECGRKLFLRRRGGLLPTEYGESILPQIDLILSTAKDIAQFMAARKQGAVDDVRIATTSAVGAVLVERLYKALWKSHPRIRLHFSEGHSATILTDLHEKTVDIGIGLGDVNNSKRSDRVICDLDTYLIGRPDDPILQRDKIAFSEVIGLPLLMRSPPSICRRSLEVEAESRGKFLSVVANTSGPSAAITLLQAGTGYLVSPLLNAALASTSPINVEIEAGRLRAVQIVKPRFVRTLMVRTALNSNPSVQITAQKIVDLLLDADNTRAAGP